MKQTIRALLALLGLVALGACDRSPAPAAGEPAAAKIAAADKPAKLDQLYADFWEASLALNPVSATFVGDDRYNDQLPDFFSAEYRQRTHDFNEDWLARAKAIGIDGLEGQALLSYQIFKRDLEQDLESEQFPGWKQPLNQFYSFASQFAVLGSGASAQPFKTVKDYDDWLARAGRLPTLFDTAIANMRIGIKDGVVQPKVLMTKVVEQLDALIKDQPEDTVFWGPVTRMPEDFSSEDRERLTAAYRSLIGEQLMPAYRKLRGFVADDYLPACRETFGLSALPNGEAWYAFNVRAITTTDLAPERIHQIGLAEVARIQGEMRELMKTVKFDGDLQAFFKFMTTDPQFQFASEEALLKAYRSFDDELDPKLDKLFSLKPKAGFEIRPVEAFRAKSAAGGSYQSPSEDGTRPGIFYVNTYDLPARKTWDMQSLFLHEAKPGHHFQIALQQELTGLPKFRRFGGVTAFAEGWGLYAESLGRELGVYQDPYQYFGRLQAELWRAIRLVVDTGIHEKGWTRQQVIDYMLENSATTPTEAESETERYMAIPGQALAYKIGELKIRELRTRAEQALGDSFDVRAFHAEVLRDGSVPLQVLEDKIDRWIAAQKKA